MENHPVSDGVVFYSVLISAGVLTAIYMTLCWWKRKKHPQLLNVGIFFGGCLGLASGLNLCYMICADKIQLGAGNDEKIAIFVGGFATCWFSIVTIADGFRSRQ